ncbi:hypothetical protein [Paeniglutamicibacter antarcticus]|uniref:Uncharacterized protein n=1 Tax=Paeniglutamicibacter antarcticus TaxID=494023 RepID=A0ABP9TKL6_9MICC
MNPSPRPVPTFLTWAATFVAVAISVAAGWIALGTATGEIGPLDADGAPTDVEFWTPIGWTAMAAVLPITVAAWKSARWGAIALAGATGVQVIVATVVIGQYAASDFNSGGLEGLIFLVPIALGVIGATSSLIAVMVHRHHAKS